MSERDSQLPRSRLFHALAVLTALATFPLIFMGGLVTSHHAGMSVPDWPNSRGYNMFLFPPNQWVGGILYEHTHRLMGTVVGFLAVTVAVWAWMPLADAKWRRRIVIAMLLTAAVALAGFVEIRFVRIRSLQPEVIAIAVSCLGLALVGLIAWATKFEARPERRPWVRWLSLGVLGMVLLQGVLGGLRVVLAQLDLAIVHACVAQAFFCLATLLAIVTSRGWRTAGDFAHDPGIRMLARLAAVATIVIYLQLALGATMRHFDAGLAIPDLPLAYGKLLPPMNADALRAVNHVRAFELNMDPVTLTQVWLHFGHRVGAIAVSVLIVWLAVLAWRRPPGSGVRQFAPLLLFLLASQLTLGVLTVLLKKPADIASAHVAVGALVLVSSFALMVRAARLARFKALAVPTLNKTVVERQFRIPSLSMRGEGRMTALRDSAETIGTPCIPKPSSL